MTLKEKIRLVKEERTKFMSGQNPLSVDFIISTWFGSGLIIPAPGTWGTVGGILFALPLLFIFGPAATFWTGVALFAIGIFCVSRLEKKLDDHDPSFIVIDEVAAIVMLIPLLPVTSTTTSFSITALLAGFLLFRFFDAKKPWLIGLADRKIKGAWGVMVDDLVAAVFSFLCFYILYIPFDMLYMMLSGTQDS